MPGDGDIGCRQVRVCGFVLGYFGAFAKPVVRQGRKATGLTTQWDEEERAVAELERGV